MHINVTMPKINVQKGAEEKGSRKYLSNENRAKVPNRYKLRNMR